MRSFEKVDADMRQVIGDIDITDRKSFKLNVKFAKGKISREELNKSLSEMRKDREKLFAKMIKLEKELEALGYKANIKF